jgi:hypothetical protein
MDMLGHFEPGMLLSESGLGTRLTATAVFLDRGAGDSIIRVTGNEDEYRCEEGTDHRNFAVSLRTNRWRAVFDHLSYPVTVDLKFAGPKLSALLIS